MPINTALDKTAVLLGIILAACFNGLLANVAAAELYPALAPASHGTSFPEPQNLRNAISFWQKVFTGWGRHQVALHDAEALGVIYEVINLPGYVEDGQTESQRAYVDARRRMLAEDLRVLETRVRYNLPLDARLQQLLATIQSGGPNASVYGASERLRSQRGMRERFRDGVQISGRYDALMRKAFRDRGLPDDLAYLPHVESSFQSRARSFAGAAGAWQFMPATGRLHLNMNAAVDERYDPILAAQGAARYLAGAYDQLGNWGLAVTSYNHGVAGMLRAQEQFGNDIGRIVHYYRGPAFGFASRNFYVEFLAVREVLNNLPRFFGDGVRLELPLDHERVRLPQPMHISELASFFQLSEATLATINPALTNAAVRDYCPIPAYSDIWVPRGTLARSASLDSFQPAVANTRHFESRLIPTAYHAARQSHHSQRHAHAAHGRHADKSRPRARKSALFQAHKRKARGLKGRRIALR